MSSEQSTLRWIVEVVGASGVVTIGPFLTDDAATRIAERVIETHPQVGVGVRPLYSTSADDLDQLLAALPRVPWLERLWRRLKWPRI